MSIIIVWSCNLYSSTFSYFKKTGSDPVFHKNVKIAIDNAKKAIKKNSYLQSTVEESFNKIINKKIEYNLTDNKIADISIDEINEFNKEISIINSNCSKI